MVIAKKIQKKSPYHNFFLFFKKKNLKNKIIPLPYFFQKNLDEPLKIMVVY